MEKTGPRACATVHPTFNYDLATGNPNGIFIERVHITLSADGAGTLTGTRIAVEGPFPFALPP